MATHLCYRYGEMALAVSVGMMLMFLYSTLVPAGHACAGWHLHCKSGISANCTWRIYGKHPTLQTIRETMVYNLSWGWPMLSLMLRIAWMKLKTLQHHPRWLCNGQCNGIHGHGSWRRRAVSLQSKYHCPYDGSCIPCPKPDLCCQRTRRGLFCGKEIPDGQKVLCSSEGQCDGRMWYHLSCLKLKKAPCGIARIVNINSYPLTTNWSTQNSWCGNSWTSRVRHVAIRYSDGNAMIAHWKYDLIEFYLRNHQIFHLCPLCVVSHTRRCISTTSSCAKV